MIGRALAAVAAGLLVALLAIPLAALLIEAPLGEIPELLQSQVVRDAVEVTVKTNLVANVLILALGTPAAWLLATRRFRGRALVLTLCELPLVLPPAVAGIALLSAFAPTGLFGGALADAGIVIPFSPWAVVLAVTFVAAPFYLRQAIAAFESVDPDLTDVAKTLGASPTRAFWRVALPLAAGGLVAGWVLAFARGIAEFGATIIFAGNVQGETSTLTLTVYQQLEVDLDVALALSVVLLALSAGILLSYKLLATWRPSISRSSPGFEPSRST
jgi:molybdate transport system permease protein